MDHGGGGIADGGAALGHQAADAGIADGHDVHAAAAGRVEGGQLVQPPQVGGAQRGEAFLKTSPGCVLLDDAGACGAYPVRPMTCRNHYVTSPPEACGPTATRDTTVRSLPAAVDVTRPLVANLRRTVEQQGADFAASLHLIPEWLAHLLDVEQDPWRA